MDIIVPGRTPRPLMRFQKDFFVRPLKDWRDDRAKWETQMKTDAEEAARADGLEQLLLVQIRILEDFLENAALIRVVYHCKRVRSFVVAPGQKAGAS